MRMISSRLKNSLIFRSFAVMFLLIMCIHFMGVNAFVYADTFYRVRVTSDYYAVENGSESELDKLVPSNQVVEEGAPIEDIFLKFLSDNDMDFVSVDVLEMPQGLAYDDIRGCVTGTPLIMGWYQDETERVFEFYVASSCNNLGGQVTVKRVIPDVHRDYTYDWLGRGIERPPMDVISVENGSQTVMNREFIEPMRIELYNTIFDFDPISIDILGLPKGLIYESDDQEVSGAPDISVWDEGETEKIFDIWFVCEFSAVKVSLTVLRSVGDITDMRLGDFSGDGEVDDKDVVYLLRHTLSAEDYPLEGYADFNHDGAVDDQDVVYLLRHTLSREDYPLSVASTLGLDALPVEDKKTLRV